MNNIITYEITKKIAVLSNKNSITKEVNFIKFNDSEEKLDIRKWDHSNNRKLQGISLTIDEALKLIEALDTIRP